MKYSELKDGYIIDAPSIDIDDWKKLKNHHQLIYRPKKNNWIKCSDRLPHNTKKVLCIDEEQWMEVGRFDIRENKWWFLYCGYRTNSYVTHWQPLPEPPEE